MKIKYHLLSCLFAFAVLLTPSIFASSVLSPITDTVNSGVINTKILADQRLSNIDIDATVENGIVIYTGRVNSRGQLNELIRIAHSVSGIRGVDVSGVRVGPSF